MEQWTKAIPSTNLSLTRGRNLGRKLDRDEGAICRDMAQRPKGKEEEHPFHFNERQWKGKVQMKVNFQVWEKQVKGILLWDLVFSSWRKNETELQYRGSLPSDGHTHAHTCTSLRSLRRWQGFPGGANSKESTCQCRRQRRCGFNPWIRKIRGQQGNPLQYSCLENLTDRGA